MKSTSTHGKTAKKPAPAAVFNPPDLCSEELCTRIALSAYYKAEARGFMPGHELEDWLTAEAEEK